MILLPHFDIPYGFGLGKIPYDLPFQGPVFFGPLYSMFLVHQNLLDLNSLPNGENMTFLQLSQRRLDPGKETLKGFFQV